MTARRRPSAGITPKPSAAAAAAAAAAGARVQRRCPARTLTRMAWRCAKGRGARACGVQPRAGGRPGPMPDACLLDHRRRAPQRQRLPRIQHSAHLVRVELMPARQRGVRPPARKCQLQTGRGTSQASSPLSWAARRGRTLRRASARAAARGVRRQARHLPAGPPARAVRLRRVRGAAAGRARADVHAVRGARGRRRGQEVEVVHAHPPRRRARGARRRAPDAPADARACGAAPARPGRGRSGAAALPGERCRGWVGRAAAGAAWPAGARDECEGER